MDITKGDVFRHKAMGYYALHIGTDYEDTKDDIVGSYHYIDFGVRDSSNIFFSVIETTQRTAKIKLYTTENGFKKDFIPSGRYIHWNQNTLSSEVYKPNTNEFIVSKKDIESAVSDGYLSKETKAVVKPTKSSLTTCLIIGGILIAGIWYWNKKKN